MKSNDKQMFFVGSSNICAVENKIGIADESWGAAILILISFKRIILFSGFACDVEINEGVLVSERGCKAHRSSNQKDFGQFRRRWGPQNMNSVQLTQTLAGLSLYEYLL